MEYRKIMALGKSSRVVSLPIEWLKSYNLDKGDTLQITQQRNGSIIIHPVAREDDEIKKITLNIKADENENSVVRRLIGAFLNGYTLITLTSDKIFTGDQQAAIREASRRLYMMVIKSEAASIELETLIDESKASVTSCIERMHMITYSLFKDTIQAMKDWDRELIVSAISLEEDIDQLAYLVLRIIRIASVNYHLANQLNLDPLDALDFQTLVHRIERIADHITSMANCMNTMIENNERLPEQAREVLIEAAEIALNSYGKAVECYMYMDVEPTNKVIDQQSEIEQLYSKITPLPRYREITDTSVLTHTVNLRENILKISNLAADIAELTIDRAYKSEA
ncbi:phosphate uptake regulator PhoU [Candidatus Bathyarchaeota archaeon]|nr:phosphate uptake regulator PhoU [Candidatus Bathyarchaeota archaeon]